MSDFADGLQEPFSDVERYCFEQLYFPQSAYGGLSLVVLGEKLQFAEGVLWQLVLPSSDAVDAKSNFYSVVNLYSQLTEITRSTDRVRKAPISGTAIGGQEGDIDVEETPGADLSDVVDSAMTARRVIDYLLEAGLLECRCKQGRWRIQDATSSAPELRIRLICGQCKVEVGPLNVELGKLQSLFTSENDDH